MRAVIYAAGVGKRLGGGVPKALLRFGGHSLLERHVRLLGACGVDPVVVCTGFRAEAIAAELARLGNAARVGVIHNPDYEAGSIVTQWVAREALSAGGPALIMDADVLYDQRLLARLIGSPHPDCFLLDRAIEPGDEPVKLCIRDGEVVDFHKRPRQACDWFGESVGFFKLTAATARRLVGATRRYIEAGRTGEDYEEALRDLLLADPPGRFGFEEVTGLPWLEIDFAADIERARREVLPRLEPLP